MYPLTSSACIESIIDGGRPADLSMHLRQHQPRQVFPLLSRDFKLPFLASCSSDYANANSSLDDPTQVYHSATYRSIAQCPSRKRLPRPSQQRRPKDPPVRPRRPLRDHPRRRSDGRYPRPDVGQIVHLQIPVIYPLGHLPRMSLPCGAMLIPQHVLLP